MFHSSTVLPTPVPASLEAFSGDGPFSVVCNVSGLANENQIQWRRIVNDTDLEAYRQMSSETCITPAESTTTDTPSSASGSGLGLGSGSGVSSAIGPTDMPPYFLANAEEVADGSRLMFNMITFEDEGYYVCLVSISTGICYSESLNLTGNFSLTVRKMYKTFDMPTLYESSCSHISISWCA